MTKIRIAAVLMAAPLLLTACGVNSSSSSSSSDVATDMAAAQPGQQVDKNTFVETVSKGSSDAKTYAMDMTMNYSGRQTGTMTMTGTADVADQTNPKMKMSMQLPSAAGGASQGTMDMILIDKTMYMKMPGSAGKYFKMTTDQMSKLSKQDITQAMNPSSQLEKMKSSLKQVTYVGEEDIEGAKTRHYKAVLDTAAIGPSASMASSAGMPNELPYDLWLDEQNRTRKFTMDMSMNGMQVKYDGKLSKFGQPVSITAPPASQVQPLPKGAIPNG